MLVLRKSKWKTNHCPCSNNNNPASIFNNSSTNLINNCYTTINYGACSTNYHRKHVSSDKVYVSV